MNYLSKINNLVNKEPKIVKKLAGGSINNVYLIEAEGECYVLKENNINNFPSMFEIEFNNLTSLHSINSNLIVKPIEFGYNNQSQYLLLPYYKQIGITTKHQQNFATALAHFHTNYSNQHGLAQNNYIGSLVQKNYQCAKWLDLFINCRLLPLLQTAAHQNLLDKNIIKDFEILIRKLDNYIPLCKPSPLHGDLWMGNIIFTHNHQTVLIDPAHYYGHNEMEFAILNLFGGLTDDFYEAYFDILPKMPLYKERQNIYQLYPLLVHLILFGDSYLPAIKKRIGLFI